MILLLFLLKFVLSAIPLYFVQNKYSDLTKCTSLTSKTIYPVDANGEVTYYGGGKCTKYRWVSETVYNKSSCTDEFVSWAWNACDGVGHTMSALNTGESVSIPAQDVIRLYYELSDTKCAGDLKKASILSNIVNCDYAHGKCLGSTISDKYFTLCGTNSFPEVLNVKKSIENGGIQVFMCVITYLLSLSLLVL